ncbi:MAG: HAMP domain-containing protein [Lachnospiraceae bacterium]|nr:HAMP domain-containing protein [Lachnospiraceae bacterium]
MNKTKEIKPKHKNFISIKTKLLGIILPVMAVIIVVLIGLSYYVSKRVVQSDAQKLLKTSMESQVSEIEEWLDKNLSSFSMAKQAIEWTNLDEKQMQSFLDAYYGFNSNFPGGIYIADMEGRVYKGREGASRGPGAELRGPDSKGNYIKDGKFKNNGKLGDNGIWQFYTALEGKGDARIRNGEVYISTDSEGTVDYSIQLVQAGVPVKEGASYKLKFDAYANEERIIKTGISAPDRDYQRYLEDTEVNLTKEKQTFTYEFTMAGNDDANGRLEFNLGAMGSAAGVKISNVSLIETSASDGSTDSKNNGDASIVQTEWFQDALSRVNMGFTNAYTNGNGEQVISACGMLRSYDNKVYVISADLSLDKISVYVNSFVKMENAESFLVNISDNTVIASRDPSLISQPLDGMDNKFMKEAGRRIAQNNLGIAEIDGNMSVFEKVDGTEWVLVSYVPSKTIYQDLDFIRNVMVLFGIVSILVMMVLFERIIHVVINPVKKLTDVIKTMTSGDFTVSIHTKSNDEIGVMGRCVEKFIAAMSAMIASIDNVSDKLHKQADNSQDVSGQMFQASKEQNMSMKELNNTVEQLSQSVGEIAQSATTLAMLVEETKEDGDGVNSKMKETVTVSQTGKDAMQDVSSAMQDINSSVKKLQSAIDEVGRTSEEITNITRVIGEIADETNLLSLNASIEAARAGDAGKGFAVVALEIGKLAQTSMDSVQHIDRLVLEIKTSVQDVVNQADNSVKSIGSSSVLIGNAVNTFDVIFDNIEETGHLVQNMIQKVDQVEDVARNVAAISEEQAASSQEILGSSDILVEQADRLMESSETVARESEELTNSAEELAAQIGNFNI